jgi:ADP-heptose:LPS heptosyltransferase
MPDRARTRLTLLKMAARLAPGSAPVRSDEPRLLVVRPDHIGDLIFLSPALDELRAGLPEAHITLAVGPWAVGLAQLLPQVDRIEVHPFPGFQRGPKPPLPAPYARSARLALDWTGRYDACLIARPDHWWGAMTAAFAGIPHRYGWETPETKPFLSSALVADGLQHEVVTNLTLVRHFLSDQGRAPASQPVSPGTPALSLRVPSEATEGACRWLQRVVGRDHDFIVVHPGAGAPTKLWPEARYHALLRALDARTGLPIVVTGSLNEADLVESVASACPNAIPAAGEFNLGELSWVLGRARVVVGSDSGPLHLAAALGGRTVHIFGPADPRKFGPWSPPTHHRILVAELPCRPCGNLSECKATPALACMGAVQVEDVLAAALDLAGY